MNGLTIYIAVLLSVWFVFWWWRNDLYKDAALLLSHWLIEDLEDDKNDENDKNDEIYDSIHTKGNKEMSKDILAADLFKKWVKRLGLQDWNIEIDTNVDSKLMEIEDADGCTIMEESIKAAVIQISKPDDSPDRFRLYNFEETLVHELLHIKFCFLQTDNKDSLQDRIVHQLIDDLARALIDAETKRDTLDIIAE